MPERIEFTSVLGPDQRDAVERLLFFNGNQARVVDAVAFVARHYGIPRLRVVAECLRVSLDPLDPQTLFAVAREHGERRVVGVAIYVRRSEQLVVLFIAVDEAYSSRGPRADADVLLRMIDELKAIARRVRGISALAVYLGRTTPTRMMLRR